MKTFLLRSLVVFSLTITSWASGAAQHGGKAEGRRVTFKPGARSAVFTGKVRGSVEVEYELEARAGQELIVRVVSVPPASAFVKVLGPDTKVLEMSCLAAKTPESNKLGLPTAAHCFEEHPLRAEGRTWSATLPQSGNYLLSIYKPEAEPGTATYSLLIVVPPAPMSTVTPSDVGSLEVAMRGFISALARRDVAAFLSYFSRGGFFYANNPLNLVRVTVSYAELKKDLSLKGDWYCTYLKRCDELDAFVDNIGDGEMWPRFDGPKFVPPGSDASSSTFVKWRREGARWVIYEIGYPQA